MRIGLISDIHANLPAFEAVIVHAQQQGVKRFWNLGDFVGYGAFPDEVVSLVRDADMLSIVGNYDQKVLVFPGKKSKWRRTKNALKYEAFRLAYDMLTAKNRRYLQRLPMERRLKHKGADILLTHGSPASNEEPLTGQTTKKRLRELAAMAKTDLICCGHSHVPFDQAVRGARFVNPGSVGRQDDGDPRASYGILSLKKSGVGFALHRVDYDIDRAVRAIRERGLPEAFAQIALRGLPLEDVM